MKEELKLQSEMKMPPRTENQRDKSRVNNEADGFRNAEDEREEL